MLTLNQIYKRSICKNGFMWTWFDFVIMKNSELVYQFSNDLKKKKIVLSFTWYSSPVV